jgi:SAM-dependent methyltransferase
MPDVPRIFDRDLHARRLARAAQSFAGAGFLKRRAAADLVERLEAINRRFETAVDLGARDGAFSRALSASPARERVGRLIQCDLSPAMLAAAAATGAGGPRVAADEERLPFAAGSVDLIVSSLAVHWVNDLVGALIQMRLALAPDGLFIGAFLGGATLTELRQSLLAAEAELRGGAGPRVSPFAEAGDGAALLQRAGFALPVADTDVVTVRYDHPLRLLADLRAMGETSALVDRPRTPLTRPLLALASEIYRRDHGGADGKVTATFEIITLTGWAPHPAQQQPLRPGSAKTRLADALGVIEHKADGRAGGEP